MESMRVIAIMIVLIAVVTLVAILSAMYAESRYISVIGDFCSSQGYDNYDSHYCIKSLGNTIIKKQMYECTGVPPGMVCNLLDMGG